MRKLVLTLTISFAASMAFAQDAAAPKDGWKKSTQFGINLAGAGFNENWQTKQGGFNNTAIGFIINSNADMLKGKGLWSNALQMNYGMVRGEFVKGTKETRKSVDRLFFDSKFARKLSPKLSWFVGGNFLTQFAEGLDYGKNKLMISNIMAPGVLSEGLGIEYKPVSYFTMQLGGATLRQTFVNNSTVFNNTDDNAAKTSYGIPAGKKSINDMGFNLVGVFDKDIVKNFNLKWRYSGFVVLASQNKSDAHKAMDHRLDLIGTAKLGKYINANVTLIGLQDKDIIDGLQSSRSLNVGLLYTL